MKADSGELKTYLKSEHIKYLHDVQKLTHSTKEILPNNEATQATIKGNLNLHWSLQHQTLVFPKLQSDLLLSIG